jgi:hypothetical protein
MSNAEFEKKESVKMGELIWLPFRRSATFRFRFRCKFYDVGMSAQSFD